MQSYPSQLSWCDNNEKCLATEAENSGRNGHPCAYYSHGKVQLCEKDPCIKLQYEKIKASEHLCAALPYNSFDITTCNQEPCITTKLEEIHKTHPCAIVEGCVLKQCSSNPCLGYKVKQMHNDGHTCASVRFEENQIQWCEHYEKCSRCITFKLFGNLNFLPYPRPTETCTCWA